MEGIISVQVIAEIAGVLYRQFRVRDTTKHVGGILSYRLRVHPVTAEVVRLASEYSRDFQILPYDGIHVATAVILGAEVIISADRELDRARLVRRVDPLDYKTRK